MLCNSKPSPISTSTEKKYSTIFIDSEVKQKRKNINMKQATGRNTKSNMKCNINIYFKAQITIKSKVMT